MLTPSFADLLEWVERPADAHAHEAEDRRLGEVVAENDHGKPPAVDEACGLEEFFVLLGEICWVAGDGRRVSQNVPCSLISKSFFAIYYSRPKLTTKKKCVTCAHVL